MRNTVECVVPRERSKQNMTECLFCGETIQTEDKIPVCKKKQCFKELVRAFSRFCQAIDEECDMDTEGFIVNGKLIRYGHFDEDYERIFELRKESQQ